jgi:hypothetical protein
MDWARILAYVTGTVERELLARNEYLAADSRIIKAQLKVRLKLSDAERRVLGEIGHRLGGKALAEVASVAPAGHYPGLVSQIYPPTNSMARRPVEARAGLGSSERSTSCHSHGQ